MTQSVNERVAPRSGGELSLALAHTLGPQREDCFMGDTAAGIMKKRQEDKVNRSRTPIPPVRMARSLLDPKNTRMHLFEHPNPHPWHRKDNFLKPAKVEKRAKVYPLPKQHLPPRLFVVSTDLAELIW